MAQKTRPLKPILSYPNKTVAQLCFQINQQLANLEQIKAVLPKELAKHALHCVINNKKLHVYTESANWAFQLRFYGNAMLEAISSNAATPVTEIQIKINNMPTALTPANKAVLPSMDVVHEIHNQGLRTADPELKQALIKLSSTLQKLQQENN
jgi:hypothetical protein